MPIHYDRLPLATYTLSTIGNGGRDGRPFHRDLTLSHMSGGCASRVRVILVELVHEFCFHLGGKVACSVSDGGEEETRRIELNSSSSRVPC